MNPRNTLVLTWLALLACAPTRPEVPGEPVEPPPVTEPTPAPAPPPTCEPWAMEEALAELAPRDGVAPVEVLRCPDGEALERAVAARRQRDVEQAEPLDIDPVPLRGGLQLYDRALRALAPGAWIVPVLFYQTPGLSPEQRALLEADGKLHAQARGLWSASGRRQWRAIQKLVREHRRDKARLRALLLRGDTVYFEDPHTAREAFLSLRLDHLFDEEVIFLRRGDAIHRLVRKPRLGYTFAEGELSGQRARLLIFDRVAARSEALEADTFWDVSRLRPPLGLMAFEVSSVTPDLLRGQARLDVGTALEAAVFDDARGRRTMAVVVPEARRGELGALVASRRRTLAMNHGILQASDLMVAEALRFDEPKTEEGQQDGTLRILWTAAYRMGQHGYRFNGDYYSVYTADGQPNVPQVCIDFVLDSAERWSGAWWAPRGEPRERSPGFLDFKELMGHERQVRRLVEYATGNPDKMQLWVYGEDERVPYRLKERFYAQVEGWSRSVQPSDIVVIYGLRGDGRNHWHAFMVYDTDPIHNIPYLTIGNAGVAKVTTWHDTMRSAPRRSVTHRIRLRPEWLSAQRRAFLGEGAPEGEARNEALPVDYEGTH